MKLLYKITGIYRKARWLMWLGGILTTTLIPMMGYGMHALNIAKDKQELATDNPELASEVTAGSLFDWITGENVGRIIAILGIIFILLLVVLQIFSFIGARTSVSGTDRDTATKEANRRQADLDEMDVEPEDGDVAFQTPSQPKPVRKSKPKPAPATDGDEDDWFID
ncbi:MULTISPECIES: hypothetical protein [Bifidobacterium]|uniref:hypothetical protein n=1 Tax=Bifidobacterium TaxID=1678 RepID=UPI001C39019C|nr:MULTISPECIES: hypothetical protein [Bifidobacterium]MBV3807327.1 hypothetical protein [Bifidobacterium adolescentis]MBV3836217.1 hypothetical protein [Bifidobacterium sp. MSK.17.10]MCG4567387.1 hypothetical protein [Bifidobacterium adolescentis]